LELAGSSIHQTYAQVHSPAEEVGRHEEGKRMNSTHWKKVAKKQAKDAYALRREANALRKEKKKIKKFAEKA
jgi:hypothetical protein